MPKILKHPRIPPAGPALDAFIEQHELTIRAKIKAKSGCGRFNLWRISGRQLARAKILRMAGQSPAAKLHQAFSSRDGGLRSAACPYEAIALRMWLLIEIRRRLSLDGSYLVTLANPKWSQPMGPLQPDCFSPVVRKVRKTIEKLRAAGHLVRGVAVIELCANRGLDGKLSWSPHFHMVICGANKQVLQKAFHVRLPAKRRGRDKPLQVKLIKPGGLGTVLSYISKMKPELRSAYVGPHGRMRRRRNHLPKFLFPYWLLAMADQPITKMVIHFGQGQDIAHRFRTAGMSFMIGELL
jgi:hypothetical protein